ncbi:unnamed protein product [Cuscuta epithymum]|uniref:HVA22-like protein n=1 Tax=Cuscuta epithymum TaxID=186058 RepID=A0AAV0CY11_9ASTE|nr:unnamed protein product [Cuscuta epithymum]
MGLLWALTTHLHAFAGPATMFIYPLYASIVATEKSSKLDSEQWLAYWIMLAFLFFIEMVFRPILEWIPIWYDVKLVLVAWMVLPYFRGAAFIYDRVVREQVILTYASSLLLQLKQHLETKSS